MKITNLADLRKNLAKIGFKVKTKSFSWGKNIIYVHKETGQELTFNVFTEELLNRWQPLILFTRENVDKDNWEGEKIFGLIL